MNNEIRKLEPYTVWNHFVDLNSTPRPSKKEEKVRAFIKKFGQSLQLETIEDTIGNILIKKPASQGMENRKKIVLQAHLDMVCQKNKNIDFNFENEGIKMMIDGDWVKAQGTTLGADNGLGVAIIMAILASKEIVHPEIEALFTVDEETGMTGAIELRSNFLSGDILLNLDTENDDEIDIGCAGGVDITATYDYKEVDTPDNHISYSLSIKGLQGGHSGMDIHKGLGNSNKLLNRFLFSFLDSHILLHFFEGGSARNAIPREATAIFSVEKNKASEILKKYNDLKEHIILEFSSIEKKLKIDLIETEKYGKSMSSEDSNKLIYAIEATHNGVFRMSPDIENLVETSNNVARIDIQKGKAAILNLTRSSVESSKWWLANSLISTFKLAGMTVECTGSYPGWKPNPNSEILKIAEETYFKINGEKPKVVACHAGLECGLIGEKYPNMDMISFGPTILGAHSPEERASIASLQKFWNYFKEVLKQIPNKN